MAGDRTKRRRQESARVRRLEREVARPRRENARLRRIIEELRRAAKRQAAPFARRRHQTTHRKPGRKPGHPAAHRAAPDHVDETVRVEGCPDCGSALHDASEHEQVVIDVPPVQPRVVRYVTQSGYCPRCRRRVRTRHPDQTSDATGAAGVQVGPRAVALASDLKHRVGVTWRKVVDIFGTHFGLSVCAGTLVRAAHRLTARAEPTYRGLIEAARTSCYAQTDETGWRVAVERAWLWVFTNADLTVYAIRRSRGVDVVQEILGEGWSGVLGCDGLPAYRSWHGLKAQCGAHILRRATELRETQTRGAHDHEVLASIGRTAHRHGQRMTDLVPAILRARDPGYVAPLVPLVRSPPPPN